MNIPPPFGTTITPNYEAAIASIDAECERMLAAQEADQTDLGASDDRPLGPDHTVYRK